MSNFTIRKVKPEDAKELLAIYRPYVEDTAISFEYEVPTVEEFKSRIIETSKIYPYIVAETNGQIAGYSYAGALRSRCAYGWSVESTVYVSNEYHRCGLGKQLYAKLFDLLRKQGAINAFAGIALPNEASVALHKSMGFEKIGIYKNIGFKHERWWDVEWYQFSLQSIDKPKDLIPFTEINL